MTTMKCILSLCLLLQLASLVVLLVLLISTISFSTEQEKANVTDVPSPSYKTNITPFGRTVKIDFLCNAGQYIKQTLTGPVCVPCPPGTFNPDNNHTYISCFPCTEPNIYEKEVELKACTLTSDTEIGCLKGYFRNVMGLHEASCDRCSKCKGPDNVIVIECAGLKNTVCRS
ncbi:tumor necrosis factor receptor superfamily member 1A [Biomphalaria glabrata]|nr:tumor necrosis factor receptor superfamily member 1A [Biomphalaria glabrata]